MFAQNRNNQLKHGLSFEGFVFHVTSQRMFACALAVIGFCLQLRSQTLLLIFFFWLDLWVVDLSGVQCRDR